MKSKKNVVSLCLLTLFASTFAAQAAGNQKMLTHKENIKFSTKDKVRNTISNHFEHNCGTEHNGQDWKQLQKEFTEQVKEQNTQKHRISGSFSSGVTTSPITAVEGSVAVNGRYYIPVVIHIYGEEYNCTNDSAKCLTDDKINDALRKMNNDFQGLSVDDPAISAQFAAIRKNLNIEFVLAKKDPDGNTTNGIVRYAHEQAGYGNNDTATQELITNDSWDNFKYMNLYIMHDLHDDDIGNNSGIAWYPELSMSTAGTARVVYNGHYTGLNTNENFRSVLTHEFGHWLNLIHTFETKTCSITNEAFCATTGDRDCDTPQMSLPSQMQANAKNCLGQPTNTENFMHYTNNYAMFTQDQVKRMTAALHGPSRSTLWSNENLIATGLELLTSDSEHPWDGISGLDVEPKGTVLETFEHISAPLGGVETFEISIPANATNILFHLDGHTADPDMYISKGSAPTTDGSGNWVADYISFNSPGTAESISLDVPDSNKPYFASIHGFTAFNNSRLRVIQGNDPFLAAGERRYSLVKIDNLWANKNDPGWTERPGKTHNYQFAIPEDATRVVVVVPGAYQGPKMADNSINNNGDVDIYVSRNRDVTLENYDCRPFSGKVLAEYCEFNGGGTFNVLLDPAETYSKATFQVYYETANTGNQLPYANTNGNRYVEAVNHAVQFSSEHSNDPDGDIVSYKWNFGDGNVSSDANATHTYAATGEYNVTLTVTDNSGETSTASTLAVITQNSPNDAELCDGCTRIYLNDEINLAALAGDAAKSYQFEVPEEALSVTFELVSRYNGDPDLFVNRDDDVSTEEGNYICGPFESPSQTELCQFTKGGVYNVIINPFLDYNSLRFRAYYDILGNTLQNGVSKTVTGSKDEEIHFTMEVPANVNTLAFDTVGGTGDADLYVKFGSTPTKNSYDCRPYKGGNSEQCGIGNIQEGTYHVMLRGYQNFSGVSITGNYTLGINLPPNAQTNGPFAGNVNDSITMRSNSTDTDGTIESYLWNFGDGTTSTLATASHTYAVAGSYTVTLTVTDDVGASTSIDTIATISGNMDSSKLQNGVVKLVSGVTDGETVYTMEVPMGATNLRFNTSGGTGDSDMHVKFGSAATQTDYDCRPWKVGSTETCTISNVQTGTYYIMLLGYNNYTDVKLVGTYTP